MSEENLVLKLELEMDEQTAYQLDGQSRLCNWVYNHLLEKAQELKQEYIKTNNQEAAKTLYSKRGLRNLLPEIKEKHPFLKLVSLTACASPDPRTNRPWKDPRF